LEETGSTQEEQDVFIAYLKEDRDKFIKIKQLLD